MKVWNATIKKKIIFSILFFFKFNSSYDKNITKKIKQIKKKKK
jgi:hypothetical protein